MANRFMQTMFAGLVVVIVAALSGCSDDAGGDAGASKTGSFGEAICNKIAQCPQTTLYITIDECAKNVDAGAAKATAECQMCERSITCDGWSAIIDEPAKECGICPECCTTAQGAGGTSM